LLLMLLLDLLPSLLLLPSYLLLLLGFLLLLFVLAMPEGDMEVGLHLVEEEVVRGRAATAASAAA
jgi:hypothetical protein